MKTFPAFLLFSVLVFSLTGCSRSVPADLPDDTSVSFVTPAPVETTTPTEEDSPMETQSIILQNPSDSDFVRVLDYIPDAIQELKYAAADNFTGSVIYDFQDVYLRYGTVKKLMAVQEELRPMGLRLKLWDGFRPVSAQFRLWEIYPDDTYVANPNVGYSNHSRGNAIDLTLADSEGKELEMPTAFDDFSGKADRNYAEIAELPRSNALLLQSTMEKHGFQGYYGEWWHFNDTVRYDVESVFDPGVIALWQVSPGDPLPMTEAPASAAVLLEIPSGSSVTVLGYTGNHALVQFADFRGYVACLRLTPV